MLVVIEPHVYLVGNVASDPVCHEPVIDELTLALYLAMKAGTRTDEASVPIRQCACGAVCDHTDTYLIQTADGSAVYVSPDALHLVACHRDLVREDEIEFLRGLYGPAQYCDGDDDPISDFLSSDLQDRLRKGEMVF